jgi:hypothetical protein
MLPPCDPKRCEWLLAANDNGHGAQDFPVAVIPSDDTLREPDAVQDIARKVVALGCSRRRVADEVAETIFAYEGALVQIGRGQVCYCTIDDVDAHLNPEDEASYRWLSDLMAASDKRPLQKAQHRVIGRLRILAVTFAMREARIREVANDNEKFGASNDNAPSPIREDDAS